MNHPQIADAYKSTAMIPNVRVIRGFQAGCDADECAVDPMGVHLGGDVFRPPIETIGVRWWGEFRETYIDAKLDATEHNLNHHPEEIA